MAKFKCILSGNVIEFTHQVDIDSMVGHEGYIKLDEEVVTESVKAPAPSVKKTVSKAASTAQKVAA